MGSALDFAKAIRDVLTGRCQRIAAPGQWRVWRGEDGRTRWEFLK
jgi:hypothetical protein